VLGAGAVCAPDEKTEVLTLPKGEEDGLAGVELNAEVGCGWENAEVVVVVGAPKRVD